MKTKIFMLCVSLVLFCSNMSAQWTVWDPSNFTQSIVNTSKQVVETSTTAKNMINNFKEVQKVYNQGKEYYDALKSVSNLVRDAKKVQKTILMVGEISDIYVNSFQKMMNDPNYTVEELGAIAFGYTKLMEESSGLLSDLKKVIKDSSLSMTDKERMDVVDKVYSEVKKYRSLVGYYTNKTISVSFLRAKASGETQRVVALYGTNERYW